LKAKSLVRIFVLVLLLASGSIPVAAQEADRCSSAALISPGDSAADEVSDVTAPHIDIVSVTTSMPEWRILTVTFQLRDLPETLDFNRPGVGEGEIEYKWEVLVDLDGDPDTGFRGGFDHLLSSSYTASPSEDGAGISAPIEERVRASTVRLDHGGGTAVLDAKIEFSADDDTVTIRGGIPRLTAEARLAFETYDALAGVDRVGCFPLYGETVKLGDCLTGAGAALPGQVIADEVSDASPAHIDITQVDTYHRRGALTVVFHLRDLPERLTHNRPGIDEGLLEYSWDVLIDVDNDKQTGDRGTDYTLSAFHYIRPSKSGTNASASLEHVVEAFVFVPTEDGGMKGLPEMASLEVSPEDNTITLYGIIHGLNAESRLTFGAFDRLEGSDLVGCPPSLSWAEMPPLCGDVDAITPGDAVTDAPADVTAIFALDFGPSGEAPSTHVDITEITSSLSGETLTVVFHLADVPETLAFNRTGVDANSMEYRWEVSIDVDNDLGTGHGGGFDYLLSATHIVLPAGAGDNETAPIEDSVHAGVWKVGPGTIETIWSAELEVSAEEDTITLSGLVPGISAGSRLAFRTDDFLGGLSDEIACQSPVKQFLIPAPCGSGEAMIIPNQTIADTPKEELPAYIDFVQISTALAGETLAVVFHVRDLPADMVHDGAGTQKDDSRFGWGVSIDVDPSNGSGHLGFDYQLAVSYPLHQAIDEVDGSESNDVLHKAFVWERISNGFRQFEEAAIVLSPRADTVTFVGDIPGITADSRLVFDAFVAPKNSEQVLCQESPAADSVETTTTSSAKEE